jgi:hypothetical protein
MRDGAMSVWLRSFRLSGDATGMVAGSDGPKALRCFNSHRQRQPRRRCDASMVAGSDSPEGVAMLQAGSGVSVAARAIARNSRSSAAGAPLSVSSSARAAASAAPIVSSA